MKALPTYLGYIFRSPNEEYTIAKPSKSNVCYANKWLYSRPPFYKKIYKSPNKLIELLSKE